MALILGIETSCDETAAAVYDSTSKKMLSSHLFSQIKHEVYGGVVPEIASRSHLEKIDKIIDESLSQANVTLDGIDTIAVTHKPGLVGSLLIGVCFAKGLAWATGKKFIGVDHIEGHIFSSFLRDDMSANLEALPFPHICLSVSGGHTAFYLVEGFGKFRRIGGTIDDAAGEAFDKTASILGLGYPGGPAIEKLAKTKNFEDFFKYPRGKRDKKDLNLSFSGLKTAILYDLVKRGAYDLKSGATNMSDELKAQVASSLQACLGDMFEYKLSLAFKLYPEVKGFSFVGGVSANQYLTDRLEAFCASNGRDFARSPRRFAIDNGAMIAFVGAYMAEMGQYSDLYLDVMSNKTYHFHKKTPILKQK